MDLINEYALLAAVAAPVIVIAVMNVCLALNGERETLLIPTLRDFPTIAVAERVDATPAEVSMSEALEPANDEAALKAA